MKSREGLFIGEYWGGNAYFRFVGSVGDNGFVEIVYNHDGCSVGAVQFEVGTIEWNYMLSILVKIEPKL